MADDDSLVEDEEEDIAPSRPRGRFQGLLGSILKWAAIAIACMIFIVAVVVVTILIFDSNDAIRGQNFPIVSEYQDSIPEELDWYSLVGEIRGSTSDEPRKTFLITPVLGYTQEEDMVLQEIISRIPQIKERIRIYFSSRTADELQDAEDLIRIKNELREQINRMMRNKIREVVFDNYQILDF